MFTAFSRKCKSNFTRAPLCAFNHHLYLYNRIVDTRKLRLFCCHDQDSVLKQSTLRQPKTSPKVYRVGRQMCKGKLNAIPALFIKSVVSCCQGISLRFPFLYVSVSEHSLILYIIYHYQHWELHQHLWDT